MKNLLPNIYLLNNKQSLKAHLEDIQILKPFFCNDYRHDLIMNFPLNNFQFKNNKFIVEPIDSVY